MVNPVGQPFHFFIHCVILRRLVCGPRFAEALCDFPELLVQLIQIDICKYGRTDTTLRSTAVSGVVLPVLNISSFQKLANNVQEPAVFDFPAQNLNQLFVIDGIKAALYIALDEPDHTCEVRRNLTECSMTAFARSETMGMAVKDRLIDSFQNHSDNFLQEFVSERRDAQRTELSVFLRNILTPYRISLIGSVF